MDKMVRRHCAWLRFWIAIVFAASARLTLAQAGPPMVTDDPGTPGDGHFEINVATLLDRTPQGSSYEVPLIDFNYGLGDRVQLKLETPYEVDTTKPRATGVGNGLAGVKWRFLDQGEDGWQMSMYPQLEFNYSDLIALKRDIAERGTSLLLPIEIQRTIGGIEFGTEIGRWVGSRRDSWIEGVVVGKEVSESVELVAELHNERDVTSNRSEQLFNLGTRVKLSPHFNLLMSAGRDFHNSITEPANLLTYIGLQILL